MGIPKAERCPGHARTAPHEATMHPQRGSFLSRLFGGE
jgi:hypothetical protein